MVTNKRWILKLKEQLFSKDYQIVLYHHEEILRAKKTVFEIEEEIEGSRLKINPRSVVLDHNNLAERLDVFILKTKAEHDLLNDERLNLSTQHIFGIILVETSVLIVANRLSYKYFELL